MIRLLRKDNPKFVPNQLTECGRQLVNPQRGFYKIFYFVLRDEINFEEAEYSLAMNQTLVMAFIVLSKVKDSSITEEDKRDITRILTFFSERGKDVILRFAYDNTGDAPEKEPSNFKTVIEHAKALVEVVNENKDKIFILQGLMVGGWGEMHSSRYITTNKLSQILNVYEECDKDIYLAVRKPVQWRELNPSYAKIPSLDDCRVGIFNDGMLGSPTDLGTYGERTKEDVGYRCEWKKEEEISFIHNLSEVAPIGGEVIKDNENTPNWNQIVNQLKQTGVTYLNSEHDINLLNMWKDASFSGYDTKSGLSLYDYIEDKMGYRFVIKNAKVRKDREGQTIIEIKVENTGFAPAYFDTEVFVEIVNEGNTEVHKISGGLNGLIPGKTKEIGACFRESKGKINVYATRSRDSRNIFFANECDADAKVYIGRLD